MSPSNLEVWLTRTELARDSALLAWYASILSQDERERHARFVHEGSRHEYLVAHALLRTTLSHYGDVRPERWRFVFNPYGRPELAPAQTQLDLRFNLSHGNGLIACAVTLGRRVGIDVEWHQRQTPARELAERFFSPAEARDIASLPPSEQRERFFQYWTLKEAYMKAHGKGLAMSLKESWFRLADENQPHIRLEPGPADDGSRWRFWQWNPTHEHTLALAVEFSRHESADLRIQTVLPGA